jgi:phosphatidylglycerol:prolipoprotein diacylglycerol transferase
MQQVLFHIPFTTVPIYGFGVMLFLAFVAVTGWAGWRVTKVGLPREKIQDLAIVLFLSGLVGARILYMWQYADKFRDKSVLDMIKAFFAIWEGGIVFYGSVFGGLAGYLVYRQLVLKRLGINGWQLADAVAPLMAIGLAVGRVGCFLNGCCWGQVACEECQPVPLTAELGRFPLLPAHARGQVVLPPDKEARLPQLHGLQTSTGFAVVNGDPSIDPRAVARVEPGSDAEAAGLKAGDVIVAVNGQPNEIVLALYGTESGVTAAANRLKESGGEVRRPPESKGDVWVADVGFADRSAALSAQAKVLPLKANGAVDVTTHDTLGDLVRDWPRGEKELALEVERDGQRVPITYTPRTVTFFPTQVYETVSMVLLVLLLVAFQPFRRHDGQVMVVCMLGYAAHRFLNEAIRIEPTYALGLTLSQWISVGIFTAGVLLELYLRATQPKLPPGPVPLGYRAPTPQPG